MQIITALLNMAERLSVMIVKFIMDVILLILKGLGALVMKKIEVTRHEPRRDVPPTHAPQTAPVLRQRASRVDRRKKRP